MGTVPEEGTAKQRKIETGEGGGGGGGGGRRPAAEYPPMKRARTAGSGRSLPLCSLRGGIPVCCHWHTETRRTSSAPASVRASVPDERASVPTSQRTPHRRQRVRPQLLRCNVYLHTLSRYIYAAACECLHTLSRYTQHASVLYVQAYNCLNSEGDPATAAGVACAPAAPAVVDDPAARGIHYLSYSTTGSVCLRYTDT